jgi:hydroxymethylbilane synthase
LPGADGDLELSSKLRLATRGSPLALLQAERVARVLDGLRTSRGVDDGWELVIVRTRGDSETGKPISAVGGEGVFVREVQQAVMEGDADVAVHSAKDLPSVTPDGLVLACVPERADPRDALVGRSELPTGNWFDELPPGNWFDELPPGATIATGSPRRRAQLAWLRPDLTFCELRGNIATRIERAAAIGAGVMAKAALDRLGLDDHITYVFGTPEMLPQVGQGALAVECRAGDEEMLELLDQADDQLAHRALTAERSWLAHLGGGCSTPVAAFCEPGQTDPDSLELEAMISSLDGRIVLRSSAVGSDPHQLGHGLAQDMLSQGGASVLEEWAGAPGSR